MSSKHIAVIVPCYNEELTIAQVIQDFRRQLPEAEIVIADNASTDRTGEIARENGARVVDVSRRGKGAAVRHLFRTVEADYYVMVDGDATYPAASVHELLAPVMQGVADMAVGDRHTSGSYREQNKRPFHQFGNRLVTYLINTLFRSKLNDIMSGFRAFNREFVKNAPVLSDGFQVETEMTLHALDRMFNIVEIPIVYRDRPEGSHSKLSTVKDGLRVLRTIVWVFKDCRPLFFFTSVSVVFFSLSVVMGIFFYYYKYRFQGTVPPFGWLVGSASSFLIAVGSLACGFILDTIVKMDRARFEVNLIQFLEQRGRREAQMASREEKLTQRDQ